MKKINLLFLLAFSVLVSAFAPYSVRTTSTIVYHNTFETQAEISTLYIPEMDLQGTWTLDENHGLVGSKSFQMDTNPSLQPFYFYLFSPQPYTESPIRLELTVALKNNITSFGMGWQVTHNGEMAIMFARLNFTTGNIEILETTSPHIWQTVGSIPFNPRRDNVLQPFRMWVSVNPQTMTYTEFGYHAFCMINGTNKWTYPLSTVANPMPTTAPDSLMIKINPMGSSGVSASAWVDEIIMTEEQ